MINRIAYLLRNLVKRPFKIGIITARYPEKRGKSNNGVAIHTSYLTRELAKLGCEVHIFTNGEKNSITNEYIGEGKRIVHKLKEQKKIPIEDCMIKKRVSMFSFNNKVINEIFKENAKNDFDIIHSHETMTGAFMSKYFNNIKWVHTVHSLEKNRLKFMSKEERKYSRLAKWNESALNYANAVIAVSQKVKDEILKDHDIKKENVYYIQNGVDLEMFQPKIGGSEKKQVIYVGRFSAEKGIDVVVNIAKKTLTKNKDVKFIFVAQPYKVMPESMERIKNRLEKLEKKYPERLIWYKEFLSREELSKLYQESMIYIQPSRYDSCPTTVLEAMACGKAVIGSNKGGIPEVIGNAGIILPLNSKNFSDMIVHLLENYRIRERYGRKAIKRTKLFGWPGIAQKTLDLYKGVAKKRPQSEEETGHEALKELKYSDEEKIEKPDISVLIPVYNGEKYISKSIESVLKQTYPNIELIVINDASKDKTQEILEEYKRKDKRVKIFNLKKNKGRAGALNIGLQNTKGDYICFLDADDYFLKEKLRKQIEFLKKHKDIDMVYGDIKIIYEDGKKKIRKSLSLKKDPKELLIQTSKKDLNKLQAHEILDLNKKGEFIPSCSVMIRKKVFKKIRFDENLKNIEDHDLWFQIIGKDFKIKRMNIITYVYRDHAEGKSKNKEKMKIANNYIKNKLKSGKYFKTA